MPVLIFILIILMFPGCGDKTKSPITSFWANHQDKIVFHDKGDSFIQLKVIPQKPSECSAHQIRNLLFAQAMLEDGKKNFEKEYQRMTDEKLYDEMMSKSYCKIGDYGHGERSEPDIYRFIEENRKDLSKYLPQASENWLNKIQQVTEAFIPAKIFQASRSLISKNIEKFEPNLSDGYAIDDVAYLISKTVSFENMLSRRLPLFIWEYNEKDVTKMIEEISKLNNTPNYFLSIPLGLFSTGRTGHAVNLLAYNDDGIVKFIFMDPLNWNYGTHENYKRVLEPLMRFIKDPAYLQRCLARAAFFGAAHLEYINDLMDIKMDKESITTYFSHFAGIAIFGTDNIRKFFEQYYLEAFKDTKNDFTARGII